MHLQTKTYLCALVTAFVLPFFAPPLLATAQQCPENFVATVNGSGITQAEFEREMVGIREHLARMNKPVDESSLPEIRKTILENLINRVLLSQEAKKKGVMADEKAVADRLAKFKAQFASSEEYTTWLSKMNLTESDARSELGNEIAIQQFIDTQVGMNITVSDEEAKTFYDTHQDLFKQPPQVKASHILIKTDAQADQKQKDEALNKIKEIKNKLTNGGDFATLAKEFSGCPSGASGGDLGYFGQGQMVKPFEDAAFALQTGETSNIVETVFGYHLIKVTDKKPATVIPYQDVQQTLKENLKREKTNREVGAYLEKLRGAATIDRLLPTN